MSSESEEGGLSNGATRARKIGDKMTEALTRHFERCVAKKEMATNLAAVVHQ